jgi:hypothetical protein
VETTFRARFSDEEANKVPAEDKPEAIEILPAGHIPRD